MRGAACKHSVRRRTLVLHFGLTDPMSRSASWDSKADIVQRVEDLRGAMVRPVLVADGSLAMHPLALHPRSRPEECGN